MSQPVLLIDDEPSIRLAITQTLGLAGIGVTTFATMEESLSYVHVDFRGVVITDVRLPGRSGLELLGTIMQVDRELPVVLLTGHGDVGMAVDAMRAGAYDFLEKPYRAEDLVAVVQRGLEKRRLVVENRRLRRAIASTAPVPPLLGEDPATVQLRHFIASIGASGADVLLVGETGTGKEVVARHLHAADGRSGPFVAINCAAVPETLFESEMFGHEAGAFSGAIKRRIGKFELARGGSVFLDEVESLPLTMQAKLLRVLQERTMERIGGNESIVLDCRVIAASKVDLLDESRAQRFREDLYYRIATVTARIPSLRERSSDIPLLFARFVQDACIRYGRRIPDWTAAQMASWQAQPWRGNVRELKAFAERHVLGIGEVLPTVAGDALSLPRQVDIFERRLIRESLGRCGGNVALASERLGIPRKTLYDKIKRHGIVMQDDESDGS